MLDEEMINLDNYNNPYVSPNTYILDKQIGDVNGDNVLDTIYLIGDKTENIFYENIRIIVQDGSNMQEYVIFLYPNYNMGINPWLFLGNFTNSSTYEIMVNLPTPGSGALTYYYVISFLNNNAKYLFGPEDFVKLSESLQYEVIYQDNYKVLVRSNKLGQSYVIDVSARKEFYEGNIYDEYGKLIRPLEGFIIDFPHLYPIKFDGSMTYKLLTLQDIAGTSRSDGLGSIATYWKYSNGTWVLDPEMFSVML